MAPCAHALVRTPASDIAITSSEPERVVVVGRADDASHKSDATSLVYRQFGYHFSKTWEATFDVFNLLDSQDADIDYYHVFRLPGEPAAGVPGRHTHQSEPRELRRGVTMHF